MTRSLLVPLTGVVVTLAVLLQNIWLYAAGGLALLLLLVLLVGYAWRQFSRDDSSFPSSYEEVPSQPSLEDLGITEIRPKQKNAPAPAERAPKENRSSEGKDSNPTASDAPPAARSGPEPSRGGRPRAEDAPSEAGGAVSTAAPADPDDETDAASAADTDPPRTSGSDRSGTSAPDEPSTDSEERDSDGSVHVYVDPQPLGLDSAEIVQPHMEALRASIHAHTVCLIGLRGDAESYRIEACISESAHAADGGVIDSADHFLQSVAPDEPVTILVAEGEGPSFEELGYYTDEVPVGQVAVSPVRTDRGVVAYLLADRPEEGPTVPASHYRLLAQSGELLGRMLDARAEERPRREIISEEIERARSNGRPLALALVHPTDSEAISERGPEAIREAENRLEDLLVEVTDRGRVERFGELIYGVFYYDREETVDDWAEVVQEAFGDADWGANMGVAIFSDRHDGPEDLRGDATEALRVAYEAGENECIIFE